MSKNKKPDQPMTYEELEELLPQLEVIETNHTPEPEMPLIPLKRVVDLGWTRRKEIPQA